MKSEEIKALFAQFEQASVIIEGVECWSARELQSLLGYTQWRNFLNTIDKAKEACQNAGEIMTYHFADVSKMVKIGSGAEKEVDDILLTRYACYLIAQNGDSRKEQIAFAQNYFAVQTKRAKLAETEKKLSGILYERGVDDKGFAIIRSKGDQALFRLSTAMLKRKLGVPDNRPVADFLPTINIKAKDLAAEMTSINVQAKDLQGVKPIETEHVDNNSAVRKMLLERGIIPEQLPPAEDIKKVERKLKNDENKALKTKNKTT